MNHADKLFTPLKQEARRASCIYPLSSGHSGMSRAACRATWHDLVYAEDRRSKNDRAHPNEYDTRGGLRHPSS